MGGALNAIGSIGGAISGALGGGDIFSKIMESVQKIFGSISQCMGGSCASNAGGGAAGGCPGASCE